MKKKISIFVITAIILLIFSPLALADDWYEDEPGYYILVDEEGNELTMMARQIYEGDEYISGDNKHYIVISVDKENKRAVARYERDIELPRFNLESITRETVAQNGDRSILLYATHNSESYKPSDGTESIEGEGGILDVAQTLQEALEELGANAVFDRTHHDPHDAGAYRRSRQTAVKLIQENMPVAAKFDIHRDATPKEAYATQVDGQDMSKIRLVVGRSNPNRQANEELATKLKGVADEAYPGLIKDIFIGRGSYNQDLSPRSLLFEMGTYESTKESAQESAKIMADVIVKSMFGGEIEKTTPDGEDEAEDEGEDEAEDDEVRVQPINQERGQGGTRGILWVVGAVIVGGLGFLFISSGGKEMMSKVSNFTREEFSSFFGRKRKK